MNVYIYKDYSWEPNSNTIAYYPLNSEYQYTDQSGNGKNLTNHGITIGAYQGVSCAYNNGTAANYAWYNGPMFTGNNKFTVSLWFYSLGNTSGWQSLFQTGYGTGTQAFNMALNKNVLSVGGWSNDTSLGITKINQWVNYVATNDGTSIKCYINGELIITANLTYTIPSSGKTSLLSNYIRTDSGTSDPLNGYLSNVIVENYNWDDKSVLGYYLQTKSLYGIS